MDANLSQDVISALLDEVDRLKPPGATAQFVMAVNGKKIEVSSAARYFTF